MNRRSFLTGTIAAVATGEAFVKLASAEETASLVVGDTTLLSPNKAFYLPGASSALDGNVYVKRLDGTVQWFGRILDIDFKSTPEKGIASTVTHWELLPTQDLNSSEPRKEYPWAIKDFDSVASQRLARLQKAR